jgi:hypothetical protein
MLHAPIETTSGDDAERGAPGIAKVSVSIGVNAIPWSRVLDVELCSGAWATLLGDALEEIAELEILGPHGCPLCTASPPPRHRATAKPDQSKQSASCAARGNSVHDRACRPFQYAANVVPPPVCALPPWTVHTYAVYVRPRSVNASPRRSHDAYWSRT